jgi:hypothetical protein
VRRKARGALLAVAPAANTAVAVCSKGETGALERNNAQQRPWTAVLRRRSMVVAKFPVMPLTQPKNRCRPDSPCPSRGSFVSAGGADSGSKGTVKGPAADRKRSLGRQPCARAWRQGAACRRKRERASGRPVRPFPRQQGGLPAGGLPRKIQVADPNWWLSGTGLKYKINQRNF